jgi:hypothetical protein
VVEVGRQSADAPDRAAHSQGDAVVVVLFHLVLDHLKPVSLADRVEVDRDVTALAPSSIVSIQAAAFEQFTIP